MSNQDLFTALNMLRQGAQDLATSRAVSSANQQVQQVLQAGLKEEEQRAALQQVAGSLTTTMAATGAHPMTIAQMGQAINPYDRVDNMQQALLRGTDQERSRAQSFIDTERMDQYNLMAMRRAGVGEKESTFDKTMQQEKAKTFANVQKNAAKIEDTIVDVEESLKALENYTASTTFSTGPLAGSAPFRLASPQLQNLEAKFRKLNIKAMVQTFDGMSRAVDSDAERAAWERTQASVTLNEDVNFKVLYGTKAQLLKDKAEAKAQAAYVEKNGSLDGYESEILGHQDAYINAKTGKMILVPKNKKKPAGYEYIDEYVDNRWGKKSAQRPAHERDQALRGGGDATSENATGLRRFIRFN